MLFSAQRCSRIEYSGSGSRLRVFSQFMRRNLIILSETRRPRRLLPESTLPRLAGINTKMLRERHKPNAIARCTSPIWQALLLLTLVGVHLF